MTDDDLPDYLPLPEVPDCLADQVEVVRCVICGGCDVLALDPNNTGRGPGVHMRLCPNRNA